VSVLPVLIVLLAAPLALPVSLYLLRRYRRAVFNSMRSRVNRTESEPLGPEIFTLPEQLTQAATNDSVVERNSTVSAAVGTEPLYSEVLRAPWHAAAIYAGAGFCYASVLAVLTISAMKLGFSLTQFLFWFWVYTWPVVLTVNLVAVSTWRARLATTCVYLVAILLPFGTRFTGNPTLLWEATVVWLIINLAPTAFLLTFLNRRVRAVGPLVLLFTTFAITGLLTPLILGGNNRPSGFIVDLGTTIGLIVLGLAVFGLAGWLALQLVGTLYERKKISDQSIILDAIWLVFGLNYSVGLAIEVRPMWILAGLLAFVVYKVVAWIGFGLLGRKASSLQESTNLLLLRVFSLGKRSERLFEVLAKHWRHVGSIQLIAGPDLATTTVEPHEFLDFLSGKLARRFIDGPQTLQRRISEMDLECDRDGRYRVNDFFCYEDTWQMTLSRLVGDSDAVLMDLRGFSPQNRGVVYEINELINVVPLERVVFVIDDTTDEQFLRRTIQECWDQMRPTSPNLLSTPGQLNLFQFTGSHGELRLLFRSLSESAKSALPAATGS
jgi:hypothetical protein